MVRFLVIGCLLMRCVGVASCFVTRCKFSMSVGVVLFSVEGVVSFSGEAVEGEP